MLRLFQTLPELFFACISYKGAHPRLNRGALYIIVIREYPPHLRISVFHFQFLYVYESPT
jgi:hypothetical protein